MATATARETRDDVIEASPVTKKPLSAGDMTTGLVYERNIATAQAALAAAEGAQAIFLYHLRTQYQAPEGEWKIDNWAEGFVRVEK